MIDDLRPLPDHELSNNKKIKYIFGLYHGIFYCSDCRHFELPGNYLRLRGCCPNCGGKSYFRKTGRYKIKEIETGWWIFKKTRHKIIGIDLKK